MNQIMIIILTFFFIIPAIVGTIIMSCKGRSGWAGLFLGFFLSWSGVIGTLFFANYNAIRKIMKEQQQQIIVNIQNPNRSLPGDST